MQRQSDFGPMLPGLSGLTRTVLAALVVLYVLQLIAEAWLGLPIISLLAWWPFGSGAFQPWQPLSSMLLNGPDPIGAFFSWLLLFFFLPPVEQSFGRRGVARAAGLTLLVSVALGLGLQAVGAVAGTTPFLGPDPFLTALTVLFGMSRPNATILLFFVLPVRAIWVAWGTGLMALLFFLATRSLDSALWVAGWIGGWLWLRGIDLAPLRKLTLLWRRRRLDQRIRRLDVLEGGRGRGRSDQDDGPIYH